MFKFSKKIKDLQGPVLLKEKTILPCLKKINGEYKIYEPGLLKGKSLCLFYIGKEG